MLRAAHVALLGRASALALALPLALMALTPACKNAESHHADEAESAGESGATEARAPVVLPAPHELAATPIAAAYIADPAGVLEVAGLMVPGVPPASGVIELLLGTQMPAELAHQVAPLIDTRAPWVAAHVAGEDIVHLPIAADKLAAAQQLFAGLPAAGEFGAVKLPEPALSLKAIAGDTAEGEGAPLPARVAWVDAERRALTLALTEPGLVTGRELARAYGKGGIWVTGDQAKIAELAGNFPYARVTIEGQGLDDLTITVDADPQKGLPVSPELAPGALTDLHAHAALALAASGKWAKHEAAVKQIIREINRQVDSAGFAAKMLLDPLAQQTIGVLKSWNGRAFVGIGPEGHLALGLGADDPVKAGQAAVKLLAALGDNLELARMFVSDVPKISIKRHGKAPEVHVLTVQGAKRMLPAETQPFLDAGGNLKVGIGMSARGGAVLAVIGPRAEEEVSAWAQAIDATPASDQGASNLVAVTVALAPEQLQELLAVADPRDPKALIKAGAGVRAGRAPTQVVVRQEPTRYVITSTGPKGSKPARQGHGG